MKIAFVNQAIDVISCFRNLGMAEQGNLFVCHCHWVPLVPKDYPAFPRFELRKVGVGQCVASLCACCKKALA